MKLYSIVSSKLTPQPSTLLQLLERKLFVMAGVGRGGGGGRNVRWGKICAIINLCDLFGNITVFPTSGRQHVCNSYVVFVIPVISSHTHTLTLMCLSAPIIKQPVFRLQFFPKQPVLFTLYQQFRF